MVRQKLSKGSKAKVIAEWCKCGRAIVEIVKLRSDGFYVVKWSKQVYADDYGTLFQSCDLRAL